MTTGPSERRIIFLIAAVQFVNVMDFMIVLPLGPDFAQALGIPTSRLGLVGASYTGAASIAGILGAMILDRFDRRKALAVVLGGLVMATAAAGLTTDLWTMLTARLLAGACGGPAASIALAIIADVVAPEHRGRAMGLVMGSFSVASVFGVPAGLELAHLGGWRLPFFAVAVLGALVATGVVALLPPLRQHLGAGKRERKEGMLAFLWQRPVALTLLAASILFVGHFALIPNLPAYWQFNLGYPRVHFGALYAVGGILSFVTMRLSGNLTDRFGSTGVTAGGTLLYAIGLLVTFIYPNDHPSAFVSLALFSGFMVTSSFRMIPVQALATRVPAPDQRARFMSAFSAVQHMSAAVGAVMAARLLRELPGGRLDGMDRVSWFTLGSALLVPVLLGLVELEVGRRRGGQAAGRVEVQEPFGSA